MTKDEALKLLELEGAACAITEAIIMRAYRQAVVKHHPDTRIALDDAPVVMPAQIKAAADILRQVVTASELRCITCRGSGSIQGKVGKRPCSACKGTGERQ